MQKYDFKGLRVLDRPDAFRHTLVGRYMNQAHEVEFLGTVLKLLARNECLTLAQIVHKTRTMRRTRRITPAMVFPVLEKFVEGDYIKRNVHRSKLVYMSKIQNTLADIINSGHKRTDLPLSIETRADLIENGAPNMDALTAGIRERAIKFQRERDVENAKNSAASKEPS